MRRLPLPEFFDMIGQLKTIEERAAFIRQEHTPSLESLFQYAWNKDVVFDVDTSEYVSSKVPEGLGDLNLLAAVRRFYVFTTKSPANAMKKKRLLHSLISDLSPREAKLVIDVFTQEIRKYTNFTPELVSRVYPHIPLPQVVEKTIDKIQQPEVIDAPAKNKKPKAKKIKKVNGE